MKHPLRATLAVVALMAAAPAAADIIQANPSSQNGTTVHNNNGTTSGTTVSGELGQNSGVDVLFTGTTTNGNELLLSNGQGQAKLSGALNTGTSNPNDTFALTSFNLALENNSLFDWIELSLMGEGTVSFSLLDSNGTTFTSDATGNFIYDLTNGQNKFAFQAINGQSIAGLSFTVNGPGVSNVSQIRISPAAAEGAVPEPATWAMMLVGFGAVGFSMRRRRRPVMMQMA
jgi:hypothetical protein